MRLSILVVSRNPTLLKRMLTSIADATTLPSKDVEILCSWNGEAEDEKTIENLSGHEFLIAQRLPYHFASNLNGLADLANGEFLLLINDDVILDKKSIDEAIECLINEPQAGIVGGRLRNNKDQLTHAGILFDSRHSPYHQLDQMLPADSNAVMGANKIVPAVTGALMLIRRQHYLDLHMNEDYKICGEDVELCLDVRRRLQLKVWYCPATSGIHEAESTRQQQDNQEGNTEDLCRIRMLHRQFTEHANTDQLRDELLASSREAENLRELEILRQQQMNNKLQEMEQEIQRRLPKTEKLCQEIKHWQGQSHSLQLTRLRQEEKLNRLEKEIAMLQPNK